jgi:hypothetical protein
MASSKITAHEKYFLELSWESLVLDQLTPHHLELDSLGIPRPSPYRSGEFATRPGTKESVCIRVVEKWVTPLKIFNSLPNKYVLGAVKSLLKLCSDVILFGEDRHAGATQIKIIMGTPNNVKIPFEQTEIWSELKKKMMCDRVVYKLQPVYHTKTLLKSLLELYKFMGCKNDRDLQLINQLAQPKGAMDNYTSPLATILATGPVIEMNNIVLPDKPQPTAADWDEDDQLYMEMDSRLTAAEAIAILGQEMKETGGEPDENQSTSTVQNEPKYSSPVRTVESLPEESQASSAILAVSSVICAAPSQGPNKPSRQWRKRLITITLDEDEDYVIIKKNLTCSKCRAVSE